MERSLLSNNLWFPEEYFTGATASGEIDNWVYTVGLFSSDGGAEFGDFEAGYFGLFSLGYDFAEALAVDKALVRVDYVNNDPTGNGVLNTRNLTDVVSLNATLEQGQWGLRSEVAAGSGFGTQSDITAVAIMPYYSINDQWQLVASYNYVTSDDPNGVRLDRYENRIESGRVDDAHEFYFGVNYYLCKHKLKWQTGVEYTTADDIANDGGAYDGWGLSSGIRISW
jgi:phosphate-selective porin OprO/OprP